MNDLDSLPALEVQTVSIIAAYGWRQRFESLVEAIEYVDTITDLVEDPSAPLDKIQVLVEFTTGESERCAYKDKVRTLAWMARFQPDEVD